MSTSRRICVFCGSKKGNNPAFAEKGKILGQQLAINNIEVVYGGGSVGIMNEVANGALNNNGKVHGVIPKHLNDREHAHPDITKLHITNTMHERKAMMAELSNAFIALPGGFGTFEELMEAITWLQLGIHEKPVILFNIDHYYDQLIVFIDQAVENGFISPQNRTLLKTANSIEECLDYLPLYN